MLRITVLLAVVSALMGIFSAIANADCDYSYSDGQNRTIFSPNYPLLYSNSLNCTYQISVPVGYSVYFRFTDFATEPCCDFLKFSCASGTPYGPRSFSGAIFPSTLLISGCSAVRLSFTSDGSVVNSGFSIFYSILPANIISDGFRTKPSNIFLQANQLKAQFTFNCSSSSGYMAWWSYSGYYIYNGYSYFAANDTITNGFCKVTPNYNTTFVSESLGPGSCNLMVVGSLQTRTNFSGIFVCNYGTSTSAAAILVTVNPGFVFSRRIGGPSYTALANLSITLSDEVQFLCSPQSFNVSLQSSLIQIKILRSYWITGAGSDASNIIASYNASYIIVKADPISGILYSYKCGVDAQFFTDMAYLDNTVPTFKTDAIQVYVGVVNETISITGSALGKIARDGVLSCYSPAYPPPTYYWTDVSTGQQVIGPKIDVTHSGQYTCTASNVFNGQLYQGSKSIIVEISEDEKSQGLNASNPEQNVPSQGLNAPTIILVAVVGAVVLIICITVNIVTLCLLKRKLTGPGERTNIGVYEHEIVGKRQLPPVPDRQSDNGARYIDTTVNHGEQPPSDLSPEYELYGYEQLQASKHRGVRD